MSYLDDLEIGDEIHGVVCPECGGSLAWMHGRAWCDADGYVEPEAENTDFPVIGSYDLEDE